MAPSSAFDSCGPSRAAPPEVVRLRAPASTDALAVLGADLVPARGLLLLQVRARIPGLGEVGLLETPEESAALARFGGADDVGGAASFSMGGAFLTPYANRIRGRFVPPETLLAEIEGAPRRLPANRQGPGREPASIHGLMLQSAPDRLEVEDDRASAEFSSRSFSGDWPSELTVRVEVRLEARAFAAAVRVRNVGDETSPVGVGWHPYFRLQSGRRHQARLRVPASARLVVNDYEEVFPTGEIQPVEGGRYDFRDPAGAELADGFLDDCFVHLETEGDLAPVAELRDPAAGFGYRILADVPPVSAVQVYAPVQSAFVAIEPQTNWIDPFGTQWDGGTPGMARLAPGEETAWRSRVELFELQD